MLSISFYTLRKQTDFPPVASRRVSIYLGDMCNTNEVADGAECQGDDGLVAATKDGGEFRQNCDACFNADKLKNGQTIEHLTLSLPKFKNCILLAFSRGIV